MQRSSSLGLVICKLVNICLMSYFWLGCRFLTKLLCRYDTPLVTGEMTSGVQKICDACRESSKTGKKVTLTWADSEIPADYVKV